MTVLAKLSPREREVFDLIIWGKRRAEIGAALGVSPHTVTVFRERLCRKLGVRTDAELALIHVKEATARAADHALVAAAMCAGVLKWLPFDSNDGRGELCITGLRYCSRLDAHGVPLLDEVIRNAIVGAMSTTEARAA